MRRLVATAVCCLLAAGLSFTASRACTSFCFNTPDGPIYGTNLDLKSGDGHLFVNRRGIAKQGYGATPALQTAQWVAAYGSVTFNLVGRELPWAGMNEAGLVVSTMQLNVSRCPEPDERPPFGESGLVQYLLDNCATVQEALKAAAQVRLFPHECTSHYMLADETGDCAAVEFLQGEFVSFTGDDFPVHALANAPYAACLTFIEQGVIPPFNPGASVERVAAAAAKIESFQPDAKHSAIDHSLEVLTKTVVAPKKWWSNLAGEPYTRWHVVFDIAEREVHFRTVDNTDIRRLSLRSFDLTCEAPLLMLDVNAQLEGNIDREFRPYDSETNLKIFRKNCEKLGVEVSKEAAEGLMGLFESFKCAP